MFLGISTYEGKGEGDEVWLQCRFSEASADLAKSSGTNTAHFVHCVSLGQWTSTTQEGHDLGQGCCLQLRQIQPRGAASWRPPGDLTLELGSRSFQPSGQSHAGPLRIHTHLVRGQHGREGGVSSRQHFSKCRDPPVLRPTVHSAMTGLDLPTVPPKQQALELGMELLCSNHPKKTGSKKCVIIQRVLEGLGAVEEF